MCSCGVGGGGKGQVHRPLCLLGLETSPAKMWIREWLTGSNPRDQDPRKGGGGQKWGKILHPTQCQSQHLGSHLQAMPLQLISLRGLWLVGRGCGLKQRCWSKFVGSYLGSVQSSGGRCWGLMRPLGLGQYDRKERYQAEGGCFSFIFFISFPGPNQF